MPVLLLALASCADTAIRARDCDTYAVGGLNEVRACAPPTAQDIAAACDVGEARAVACSFVKGSSRTLCRFDVSDTGNSSGHWSPREGVFVYRLQQELSDIDHTYWPRWEAVNACKPR